jgi:hypothetical protein
VYGNERRRRAPRCRARRGGAVRAPYLTVFGDYEQGGNAGLLEVFESCGALLAAMVQTAPAGKMSFHNYGASDPSGFEPWPALLWCTGRADLPGRPAPESWAWDGSPRVSASSG